MEENNVNNAVEVVDDDNRINVPEDETKAKGPLAIVKKVFAILGGVICAFLLLLVIMFGYDRVINKNEVPTAFGYGVVTIRLEAVSMSGTIEGGDMCIIQKCDEYKIMDIITYAEDIGNGNYMIVTHRIVDIVDNEDGTKEYITLGDANEGARDTLPKAKIYGKVVKVIPRGGIYVTWIKEEGGWIYIAAIIAVVGAGSYLLLKKDEAEEA